MTYQSEFTSPAPCVWYETETARRLLNEIAGDPDSRPAYVTHHQRFGRKQDEWRQFDREDVRVVALHGFCLGFFDALNAVAPDQTQRAGLSVGLDEAITKAIAAYDAALARDEEYQRLLWETGLPSGEARRIAYGAAA